MNSSVLVRWLLAVIAVLVGVIVGQVAGDLVVASGGAVATAFMTGGAAFAATVTLILLLLKATGALN